MLVNADYLNSISDKCSFVVIIVCTSFLLLLIRPLYKFSRERIPLLILFFKSCINILSLFVILFLYVTNYFLIFIPQQLKNNIFQYIIGPSYRMGLNASYLYMTILALNRFHAVFLPFSYKNVWNKSNVKYIIFATCFFTVIYTTVQFIILYSGINTPLLSLLNNGIFMPGDFPLVISFCISVLSYSAILAKFCYDYKIRKSLPSGNENAAKDRILIFIVCLVSLTPCPLLIGFYYSFNIISNYLSNSNDEQSILYVLLFTIFNCDFTLIQCIEELCLVIISKDFRKLIKRQFKRNVQTNNVSPTVFVSNNSQVVRTRQINVQRNNLEFVEKLGNID